MNPQRLSCLLLAALPIAAGGASLHCVSLEYPPLIHQDADGQVEGFAVELMNKLFQRMGDSVTVEVLPWARSLAMANDGRADCIFTLYWTEQRARFLDFSALPVFPQVVYFYARRESTLPFDGDLSSVAAYTIGTTHSVNYGPKFESARSKLHIDSSPSIQTNFLKLGMGRVDLVPSDESIANATLARAALQKYAGQIVRLSPPVDRIPSYLAFSRARHLEAVRSRFDAALAGFMASGEYARLLRQYRLQPSPAP